MRRVMVLAAVMTAMAAAPAAAAPAGMACHATASGDAQDYYRPSGGVYWELHLSGTGTCRGADGHKETVWLDGWGFSRSCSSTPAGPQWSGMGFGVTVTFDPWSETPRTTQQSWTTASNPLSVEGGDGPLMAFTVGTYPDLVPQGVATMSSVAAGCYGQHTFTAAWAVPPVDTP